MLKPSLFWIVVDSETITRSTVKILAVPHPGDTVRLTDGTASVVDRVGPPPAGGHGFLGTVYATRT